MNSSFRLIHSNRNTQHERLLLLLECVWSSAIFGWYCLVISYQMNQSHSTVSRANLSKLDEIFCHRHIAMEMVMEMNIDRKRNAHRMNYSICSFICRWRCSVRCTKRFDRNEQKNIRRWTPAGNDNQQIGQRLIANGSKSQNMCWEYFEYIFRPLNPRIINPIKVWVFNRQKNIVLCVCFVGRLGEIW